MKLYYGSRTAWTGDLIWAIMHLCGDGQTWYHTDQRHWGETINNFKQTLVWAAEAILTKNSKRNYANTIETYFHTLSIPNPDPKEKFWNWGQYILKGRIPYNSGYVAILLRYDNPNLVMELNCHGKWRTWKQDLMVQWLAKWNSEILRAPVTDEGRTFALGEFLASELYHNCGDEAGRLATIDATIDRGQRWLIS
jgi:hypothetical protein